MIDINAYKSWLAQDFFGLEYRVVGRFTLKYKFKKVIYMALTKEQKAQIVKEIADLLKDSKLTVIANYRGITVKAIQGLRKSAKENGTVVKVVKNRLMIQSLKQVDSLKDVSTENLKDQLLYAFNDTDEVSAAKSLSEFAKKQQGLDFVGGISQDGRFISAEEIDTLANLPSKNELIGGVIVLLQSPVQKTFSSLSGNIHGYLKAIENSKS